MRVPTLALVATLALGALAGCSEDEPTLRVGDASTGGTGPVGTGEPVGEGELSDAQARAALLTVANLSDDFEIDRDEDDDEDEEGPDWGCLDFEDLADDTTEDDGAEHEISFAAEEEPGIPGIFQFVSESATEAEAEEGLDQLAGYAADCTEVDTTEKDGTRWHFTVDSDQTSWATGTDQQVNLTAIGSTTVDALELPIAIHLSALRMGSTVTLVGFFDITDDAGTAPRSVVEQAALRLVAVRDGAEPPAPEPVLTGYPIGEAFRELLEGATTPPDQIA